MSYQGKTDWKHEDVVTELDMNRIESGIGEAHQRLDALTPEQIGAETPSAAQAKVDAHAGQASGAHKASTIRLEDAGGHFTSTDVEGALAEVFTHGVDGKAQVASAINAKGGAVPGSAPHSFDELAAGVGSIHVGDYSVGDKLPLTSLGKTALIDKQFDIKGYEALILPDGSFRTYETGLVYSFGSNGVEKWRSNAAAHRDMAFDPQTGTLYSARSDKLVNWYPEATGTKNEFGGPALAQIPTKLEFFNGNLYVGYGNYAVGKYLISGTNLSQKWVIGDAIGEISTSGIEVDNEENIYICSSSSDYGIKKRDKNGVNLWTTSGTTFYSPRLVLDRPNKRLYATSSGGYLRRIDTETGKVLWTISLTATSATVRMLGHDDQGDVYCLIDGTELVKIRSDGQIIWREPNLRLYGGPSRRSILGDTIYVFDWDGHFNGLMVTRLTQSLTITN